jgi:hypothetical protein
VKKVRYLAGIAGLAPAAAGMLLPATANAATNAAAHTAGHAAAAHQPARSAAGTKTVSLRPGAVPAAGCGGKDGANEFASSNGGTQVSEIFWYTPDGGLTCIGTVLIDVEYAKPGCKTWNVHINGAIRASRKICASSPVGDGYGGAGSVGIHTYYSNPVQVCVGAANTGAYPCKTVD